MYKGKGEGNRKKRPDEDGAIHRYLEIRLAEFAKVGGRVKGRSSRSSSLWTGRFLLTMEFGNASWKAWWHARKRQPTEQYRPSIRLSDCDTGYEQFGAEQSEVVLEWTTRLQRSANGRLSSSSSSSVLFGLGSFLILESESDSLSLPKPRILSGPRFYNIAKWRKNLWVKGQVSMILDSRQRSELLLRLVVQSSVRADNAGVEAE